MITVNPIHCGDFRITKKNIFKEDFGEIDLTDSMGCTYKVWDYSDINNPVQITKKTKTPFRYELENNPLGYEYRGAGPVDDGEYTVAGVLTGYYSYRGFKGANLEWAGALHGLSDYEMAFDHSGTLEGCCMFINFVEDSKGHAFYEREINNLPKNSAVSFECYISIYTYSGGYSLVGVTIFDFRAYNLRSQMSS